MVEVLDEDNEFAYYDLDGFYNFFYGYMVPSTGYIDGFSLRKYNSGVIILMPDAAGDNFTQPECPRFREASVSPFSIPSRMPPR